MFWTVLRSAVLVGALLPFVYYVVAIYCGWQFFSRQVDNHADFAPPVSILKPVRGLDREAYENFASFCRQNYPRYEILFGVTSQQDPAIPVIRKVIGDFPELPIRLLVGSEDWGSNDKVNKLCRLAREARYDLLVISDSDICVGPSYLASVVKPFRDARVGIVTCLYSGLADSCLWSELEALNLSSNFLAGVLVARQTEGVRFSLGASTAITRDQLGEIGGFEAIADFASDDFELGNRVAARGYRVELSSCTVRTRCSSRTLNEFFEQHMRWAVGLRHSRSGGYWGWGLTQGLPWSLAAIAVDHSALAAAAYCGAYLSLRLAMAWTVGVWGLRDELLRKKFWLLPLSDALGFVIWALGFMCNRIHWRGSSFDVRQRRLHARKDEQYGDKQPVHVRP
jgi:ceramide glucosyltransferase